MPTGEPAQSDPDLGTRLGAIVGEGSIEYAPVATWQHRRGPVRFYKNRGKGSRYIPRCVACFPASVPGQVIPLRFGCQLVLCPSHRDPRFLEQRSGRDFLAAMGETIKSFGIHNTRHSEALILLVRSVVQRHHPTPRHRPGSYAWPGPRRAAERVWSEGGDYHDGQVAALSLAGAIPAGISLPSSHTIRRWWRELRWLLKRDRPAPPVASAGPRKPPPTPPAAGLPPQPPVVTDNRNESHGRAPPPARLPPSRGYFHRG